MLPSSENLLDKHLKEVRRPAQGIDAAMAPAANELFGVPDDVRLIGPEGAIRAIARYMSGAYPVSFSGQVFMGETVTASTGMTHSEAQLEKDKPRYVDVFHEVKVTWKISCAGVITVIDQNQVVMASSSAYIHQEKLPLPPTTASFAITPQMCGSSSPYMLSVEANGTATGGTPGKNVGVQPVNPTFTEPLADSETLGCSTGCDVTGFAQPQAIRGGVVNTGTGALTFSQDEGSFRNPSGDWLTGRRYSSNNLGGSSLRAGSAATGSLGAGWSLPWETRLAKDASGNVILTADGGSRHIYRKSGTGFTSPVSSRSILKNLPGGGYSLTTVSKETLIFDANGLLVSKTDRSGQTETYTYADGKVASVKDAAGTMSTLQYRDDLLTRVVRADGRQADYAYTSGRLTSVTAGGVITQYGYDPAGRLASVRDGNGNFPMRIAYDTQGRVTSQTDAMGAVTTYSYATNGETDTVTPDGAVWTDLHSRNHLLSQFDPFGNRTDYLYDSKSNLTQITNPLGQRQSALYDSKSQLTSVTDGEGNITRYTYDANGNVATARDPRNNTTTYGYDAANRLTSVKSALGSTSTLSYNASGQLQSETSAMGRTYRYEYDARGNRTSAISPLGAKATASHNVSGLPVSMIDPRGSVSGVNPAGFTTSMGYDSADRLISVKDPKGAETSYTYDPGGNPVRVVDAAARATVQTFNAANQLTARKLPGDLLETYAYDVMGRPTTRAGPDGAKTTYTYDKAGRLTSVTLPRGNAAGADKASFTWTYGYDKASNPTTVKDPAGRITTTAYDANSRPVSVTDPLGSTTSRTFDAAGNIAGTSDALGKTTTVTYDKANQPVTVKDRNGGIQTFTYDLDGHPASETTPLGNKSVFGYDEDGRLTSRVEPRGNVTGADTAQFTWRTSYDAVGNATSDTDPLGNRVNRVFDALNNITQITDPTGKSTTFAYDPIGRTSQTTAPDGGVTKAAYDTAGNVITQTDANGNNTTFTYDAAGRPVKIADPLGRAVQYAYDPDGNRIKATNARGQSATTAFDARGLPLTAEYSDGTPKVTYTWDDAGRLAGIADGSGTRAIGYDAAGRPLTITAPGSTRPFTYTYGADGAVASRTYPDGRATAYSYDKDGRLTAQKQGTRTTSYTWDEAGNLLTTTLPTANSLKEARAYDRAGRLASLTEGAGTRLFTRDASGRVTSEALQQGTTTGLPQRSAYDATGRLTRVCTDTSTTTACLQGATGETYAYDKAGNRTTATSSTTTTYAYDAANQLTSTTTGTSVTNFTYDADGNQTKNASGTYGYDVLGRPKNATVGTDTYTFSYDADGNRTTAAKNKTPLRTSQWDVNAAIPRLATDLDPAGSILGDYFYGPQGEPQGVDTPTTSGFYLHDRQGSITSVRDSAGTETYKYAYSTWGTATGTAGAGSKQASAFGFTGTPADQALTGRLQFPARSYDPATGRFTTPDPRPQTAQPANSSAYAYANNDPTNQTDPSGACPLCISAGVGALIGGTLEGGIYTWQHRDEGFTWSGLGKAAGKGALIGGVSGLLMPGAGNLAARAIGLTGARATATSAIVNAGIGAGFSYAVNEANCRPTDPWDLVLGAAGGAASSLIGPGTSWLKGSLTPSGTVYAMGAPRQPGLDGLLFRALRAGESWEDDIVSLGANMKIEPWNHISNAPNDSPWISLSTDWKVSAQKYGGTVNGMVVIDPIKVTTQLENTSHHVKVPHEMYDYVKEIAFNDKEVLALLRINRDSILHHFPSGTSTDEMSRRIDEIRRGLGR
ncbi:RHS repeat-associated core domain-containing protein [Streptomyces goshikiensis]|uniref:RHS repeat-associated core domain-containing protein n=1 Tax=Streptomyces goshikiensis TaxID=1942 RepID=UPI0036BAC6E3